MSYTAATASRLSAIRAGDTAQRSFSFSVPLGTDTIQAITQIEVVRVDGQQTGAADLTIGQGAQAPAVDSNTQQSVVFWVTAGAALITSGSINYQLTFTVTTVGGATLVRDGYLAVQAPLPPTQ